jgi:hypothetical protein
VAGKVLEQAAVHIPVFGMVKDDRHRTRALVTREGREIGIQGNPAIFALIGRIQEETHRFAVEYHRQRRGKSTTRSELDAIPGVGEKRKAALLKRFKSIKAIRGADLQELQSVLPRISRLRSICIFIRKTGKTERTDFNRERQCDSYESHHGNGARAAAQGTAGYGNAPYDGQVKESIFNIIQFHIEGRRVLDLFGEPASLASKR